MLIFFLIKKTIGQLSFVSVEFCVSMVTNVGSSQNITDFETSITSAKLPSAWYNQTVLFHQSQHVHDIWQYCLHVKSPWGVLADLNKYILLAIGATESKRFRPTRCHITECGRNSICLLKAWGISAVWCGL